MTEQAQVGDTVRLTITKVYEGAVKRWLSGTLHVNGHVLDGTGCTYEILSRATATLPSEPGTWWLDRLFNVWRVQQGGEFTCIASLTADPYVYAPFRQLVLKND